eukprot:TRINITY_DN9224_c0_g1_i5.p1 TRINITY_DN9224_c0_g1~~TRINITY_DN9224_c0_g1_i5.p1  ORF type:complete len:199 (+),score=28.30 TRINITY_DN9224_c0_g1_i5:78-674(+)
MAEKRPQFGSRKLTDDSDIFSHNAWDDVDLGPEYVQMAHATIDEQKRHPVQEQAHYHEQAADFWDSFYSSHDNKFFKDRQWLFTEFPEILALSTTVLDTVPSSQQPGFSRDGYLELSLPSDKHIRDTYGGRNFQRAKFGLQTAPYIACRAISRGLQHVLSTPVARAHTSRSAKHRILEASGDESVMDMTMSGAPLTRL